MTRLEYPDQRSKKFILVPFCLLCQAFQARGLVRLGFSSTIKPILEELLDRDVNIIQMPCPESRWGGYPSGLARKPMGIMKYDTPSFKDICDDISEDLLALIKGILSVDYEIVGILGIEYSPSCSVNLQYSREGTVKRQGIFIETLQKKLEKEKINIPLLGINRRRIDKSIERIGELFKEDII